MASTDRAKTACEGEQGDLTSMKMKQNRLQSQADASWPVLCDTSYLPLQERRLADFPTWHQIQLRGTQGVVVVGLLFMQKTHRQLSFFLLLVRKALPCSQKTALLC